MVVGGGVGREREREQVSERGEGEGGGVERGSLHLQDHANPTAQLQNPALTNPALTT